jgi:uncharacterized small protein (DUF1192 family)
LKGGRSLFMTAAETELLRDFAGSLATGARADLDSLPGMGVTDVECLSRGARAAAQAAEELVLGRGDSSSAGSASSGDTNAVVFGTEEPWIVAARALGRAAEALRFAEAKRVRLLQTVANVSEAVLAGLGESTEVMLQNAAETETQREARLAEAQELFGSLSTREAERDRVASRLRELLQTAKQQKTQLAKGQKGDKTVSLVQVAELRERLEQLDREIRALRAELQRVRHSSHAPSVITSGSGSAEAQDPVTLAAVACGGAAELLQAVHDLFDNGGTLSFDDGVESLRGYAALHGPRADDVVADTSLHEAGEADNVLVDDASEDEDDAGGVGSEAPAAGKTEAGSSGLLQTARQLCQDEDRELSQLRIVCERYRQTVLSDPTLFAHLTKQDADAMFSNSATLFSQHERWAPQLRSATSDCETALADGKSSAAAIQPLVDVCASMLRSIPAVYTTYVANYSQQMIALKQCTEGSEKLRTKFAQIHEDSMEETPLDLFTLLTTPLNHVPKIKMHLDVLRTELQSIESQDAILAKVRDTMEFCVQQCTDLVTNMEAGMAQYHVDAIRAVVRWPNSAQTVSSLSHELGDRATRGIPEDESEKTMDQLDYARDVTDLLSNDSWSARSLVFDSECSGAVIVDNAERGGKRFKRMIGKLSATPSVKDQTNLRYRLVPPQASSRLVLFSDSLVVLSSKQSSKVEPTAGGQERRPGPAVQGFVFAIKLRFVRSVQEAPMDGGNRSSTRAIRLEIELPIRKAAAPVAGKKPSVACATLLLTTTSHRERRALRKALVVAVRTVNQQNLFGVSLRTLMHGLGSTGKIDRAPSDSPRSEVDVPPLVEAVTEFLGSGHLDEVGLFRLSGPASEIVALRNALDSLFAREAGGTTVMTAVLHDRLKTQIKELLKGKDIHTVAGVLKLWLRLLPAPLTTLKQYDQWIQLGDAIQKGSSGSSSMTLNQSRPHINTARKLLARLPRYNRCTLQVLVQFLAKVRDHSDVNRMNTHNLAIIFAPPLIRQQVQTRRQRTATQAEGSFVRAAMMDLAAQQTAFNVIILLIDEYDQVFADVVADRATRAGEIRTAKQVTMRAKRTQRVVGARADVDAGHSSGGEGSESPLARRVVVADDFEDEKEDPNLRKSSSAIRPDSLLPESVLSLRLEDILKQGLLHKKGGKRHNWKKRWFVLKKQFLYYFGSRTDETPKGVIDLTNARVQPRFQRAAKRPWQLAVITSDREFLMSAEDETSAEDWIRIVRSATVTQYYDPAAPPTLSPEPSKESRSTLRGILKRG